MSAAHFVTIHLEDVKIVHRISENSDLLEALDEKSGDHQSN